MHLPIPQPPKVEGAFVPFLPGDNDDLADPAAQAALARINGDLEELLRQPAGRFWEIVGSDASLVTCLDSYLRYKRCSVRCGGDCGLCCCARRVGAAPLCVSRSLAELQPLRTTLAPLHLPTGARTTTATAKALPPPPPRPARSSPTTCRAACC